MSAPQRFRKKPVEIEAMQYDGTVTLATEIIDWALAQGATITYHCDDDGSCERDSHELSIRTLEGTMTALPGDWIIRGIGQRVTLPGAGLEALDPVAVRASNYAGMTFDLVEDRGDGLERGDVRRLPVHVVEVEGSMVLAVSAVDAAALDLVRSDPRLQLTDPISRLGVHLLAVAGVLQPPPTPGRSLFSGGSDARWTRPTAAEIGAEPGVSASGRELDAALHADKLGLHEAIISDFYPCKPDIFEQTYEHLVLASAVPPPTPETDEERAGEARADLGRAITSYYSVVEPETYVDGWVVVSHKRTAELEQEGKTIVGVVTPEQPWPLTRGLLDIALTSERDLQSR